MLTVNPSLVERTTALTDVMIVVVALGYGVALARHHHWWWAAAFGTVAATALCGTVVHGMALEPSAQRVGLTAIFIGLAMAVALFTWCAVEDGTRFGIKWLPAAIGCVCGLALWDVLQGQAPHLVLTRTAGVAMVLALLTYGRLLLRRVPGAALVEGGLLLTAAAGYAQSRHDWMLVVVWPFDHNGIFHLLQIVALPVLARGAAQLRDSIDAPRETG